jgi:hypothetical protein
MKESFMAGLRAGPLLLLAAIGTLGLGGCAKKGISGELQMFKDGGRTVSEFTDTDAGALHAKKCQTGTIDRVAALLCEYGSPDQASQGQAAAEGWFGETGTALVLRRELVLLALSDRGHVDPNGKVISAIAKLFRRVGKR